MNNEPILYILAIILLLIIYILHTLYDITVCKFKSDKEIVDIIIKHLEAHDDFLRNKK